VIPEQPINRKLGPDETLQRIPVQTGVPVTVNGKINGYKSNVYAVTIGAGQSLNVKFDTRSTSAYFNVIDGADGSGAALHRSEVDGKVATVTATRPTTYLIQPFLVRAVARRGRTAEYTLTITRNSRAAAAPSAGKPIIETTAARTGAMAPKSGPLSTGNMPAHCRGEASAIYKVRPNYIKTAGIKNEPNGGYSIDGTADLGRQGRKPFRCRFSAKREFIDVMSLVNEGRL